MNERLARILGPLLGIALFCAAIWVLGREFRHHQLGDVVAHLREIPTSQLLVSLWLTALSYLALTGYDTLAARSYVGVKLGYPRIALTSFIAYVFSHNIGLAFFGGSAVELRAARLPGRPHRRLQRADLLARLRDAGRRGVRAGARAAAARVAQPER